MPLFAALTGIVALGLAAAALPSSLPATVPYEPPEASGGAGLSLSALFVLLVRQLFQLLGFELSLSSAGGLEGFARLMAAIARLLHRSLPLVLGGSVLVGIASALSYATRKPSPSAAVSLGDTATSNASVTKETSLQSVADPSNEVYQAWQSMVRQLDIDRLDSKTPAECAAIALEAGLSQPAVETLTTEFEAVRYGGAPLTNERERSARRALSQLDIETELTPNVESDERGSDRE